MASRAVAPVYLYVLVGEVAAPRRRRGRTLLEARQDPNLIPGERRIRLRLLVRYGLAVLEDLERAEIKLHTLRVERHPRIAHRVEYPAPVGVLAVDGGLDEVAPDDDLGERRGRRLILSALDDDLDELRCPLAVACDLFSELAHHSLDGLLESRIVRRVGCNGLVSCGAIRHEENHVVGGGVTIDGDAVEGFVRRLA